MSLLGKIFVVVVTVLSLVFLGVESANYYHHTNWREATERLRERYQKVVEAKNGEIERLNGSIKSMDDTLKSLNANVAQLKDLNKATEDRVTNKSEEFNKLRGDHDQVLGQNKVLGDSIQSKDKDIADKGATIDQLRQDLNTALGNKDTAEAQVARLIGQKAALEKDLGEVRKEYSDTKQKLLDMQLVMDQLERQGIPVSTLVMNHKPVPRINAKVAGVKSDATPALVLLTAGKDDKVEKGFIFHVYRGSEFIGNVLVEKVNADSCGCRVLLTAQGKTIKAGDDAATQLD